MKKEEEANEGGSSGRPVRTGVHISFVFFLVFTAYRALEGVQSSLNFESGLGTISISLVYAGYVLSAATFASSVVHCLTPKWSIACSMASLIRWSSGTMFLAPAFAGSA